MFNNGAGRRRRGKQPRSARMRAPGDETRVPHPARRISALPRGHVVASQNSPARKLPLPSFRGCSGGPQREACAGAPWSTLRGGCRSRLRRACGCARGCCQRVGLATAAQRLRARCSIASAVLACERAGGRGRPLLRAGLWVWCALSRTERVLGCLRLDCASTCVCACLQMSKV